MASTTVEDYLKQVYLAEREGGGGPLVAMGVLASAVGVTPGTATTMVKSLAEAGLLNYEPREGVKLTTAGAKLARGVLRRHRLVEQFLVEVLGYDWSEVHDEAEVLEHAVSEKLLERIDKLLGRPETDPHGDPIPKPTDGRRPERSKPVETLADCLIDQPLVVARVLDQSAEFLRFLERSGLTPGVGLEVTEREAEAEAVVVKVGRKRITLGTAAAAKVQVDSP
ncbi:MAG: metal-dependent transcriptional regulator [Planctomycetota bacterium]